MYHLLLLSAATGAPFRMAVVQQSKWIKLISGILGLHCRGPYGTLGPYWPGPYGHPWALIARALMGPPGHLWASLGL